MADMSTHRKIKVSIIMCQSEYFPLCERNSYFNEYIHFS